MALPFSTENQVQNVTENHYKQLMQFSFMYPNLPGIMKNYGNSEIASWEPDYDSISDKLETDRNLERKVIKALQENVFINCKNIKVRVTERLVFLEGTVHAQKERISAQGCIADLFGIRAVINYLTYPNAFSH